jgi:hypothetical protein
LPVSKKTRPRRPAPAGRAAATASAAPGGTAPAASGGTAPAAPGRTAPAAPDELAGLMTAISAGDPLRAELETASWMGLPHAVGRASAEDTETFVQEVLVQGAVRKRTPEAAALLRVLMSLGTPATKRVASQGLARLTNAGIYPPDWVTQVSKPVPVQAWRRYDPFGDDEFIAVTFGYGEAQHGIVVQVDLTGLPLAVMVGVVADPANLIEAMNREDDPFARHEGIGLAEARRRTEAPLARCDQETNPGVSRDTLIYLPIARSRVRRLPTDDAEQATVFTAADRAAAVDDFLNGPLAAEALAAEALPPEALAADPGSMRFWAEVLTGYSSRMTGEPPGQVGPRKLAHILLGHVPNTFTLSPAQREHLEPAVTAWTRWAAQHQGLDEAATARLTERVPQVVSRFDEAYDDPEAVAARGYLTDLAASDADVAWLARQLARRVFALPIEGADQGDVSNPAGRRALVEAEFAACAPPGDMTSEQFVAAADRVISELWHNDPEATFQTARRMFADGADRHDIIHALVQAQDSPATR